MSVGICRPGGSGFFTLTLHDKRLAYLQCIKHIPPMPLALGQVPEQAPEDTLFNTITLRFYELWSEELWWDITGRGDPYGALCLQARYGNLGLRKLIKSPITADIRAMNYDIQHARWHMDIDYDPEGMRASICGKTLPTQFTLSHVKMIGFE